MEEQFVPYEIALQLKEKGFKELCIGWWYNPTGNDPDLFLVENRKGEDNNSVVLDPNKKEMRDVCNWKKICEESKYSCSAPLWQQVIDWLESKHGVAINITTFVNAEDGKPHIKMFYVHKHPLVVLPKTFECGVSDTLKTKYDVIEYALTLI